MCGIWSRRGRAADRSRARRSAGHPSHRSHSTVMNDCLFCKIIAGQIPGRFVHEDHEIVAIRDINPQAPLHVLIVPRRHIATLNDLGPHDDALVGAMQRVAAAIAKEHGYADRRLSDRVQHQPRRRSDGLPHPPAPARGPDRSPGRPGPGFGIRDSGFGSSEGECSRPSMIARLTSPLR